MRRTLTSLAPLLLALPVVHAGEPSAIDQRWYATPAFSYSVQSDSADGLGAQLSVGRPFGEHVDVQLKGLYSSFDGEAGGPSTLRYGGGVDLLYFLDRADLSPFLLAGIAGANLERQEHTTDAFLADAGVGVRYALGPNLALHADARYRLNTDFTVSRNELSFNLGFAIPFGSRPDNGSASSLVGPVDSDGDGVFDEDDRCQGTPVGTPTDIYGCDLKARRKGQESCVESTESAREHEHCPAVPE